MATPITYRDLIQSSLRLNGIIAQGQDASGDEVTDGLTVLQELIDAWNSTGAAILYTTATQIFTLTPGQSVYTIGPTGDMVVGTRPSKLSGAWVRDLSNNTDLPLAVMADSDFFNIPQKTATSSYPQAVYIDRQFPNGNVYLYPVPNQSDVALVLQYTAPLDSTIELDTVCDLPPAFRQALRYNLAINLAPEYGLEPTPTVQSIAITSLNNINANNIQPYEIDFGGLNVFNITTGTTQ